MTLAQIIYEVGELGLKNQSMELDLRGFINRAVRNVCDRRNFTFMHNRSTITVVGSSTSANLGATFKQLSGEQSPVSYTYGIYNLPVYVASREEIERRGVWPWVNGPMFTPTPGGAWPMRVVFIEQNGPGGSWTINIPPQFAPSTDLEFNVSAYWYPADLALGTDHNAVTDDGQLAEAVVNLTRAIAWSSVDPSDKRAQASREIYEDYFSKSTYADSGKQFQGRTLRM